MLLHSLSHLILRTTPWIRQDNYYYDFHFINEETEGQKVKWFNESHTVDMWQNHAWSSVSHSTFSCHSESPYASKNLTDSEFLRIG